MGEKIAQKLYQWLEQLPHKPDWLLYNSNVREDILALEPTADVTRRQRQYVIEKLSLCCLIMAAGVFLSLVVWIKGNQDTQIVDNRLYREDYDGSSQSLKLTADNGETKAQFDLDDTYTITLAETDYSFSHDCSNAGFDVDEKVTIRDLFYGTILPSGADAAVGLAAYVAGSHEAFVDMMNEKLDELGLSDTAHMTNCVGLYDENHYCSVYDMAIILKAAMDNPICREVMSAHTYNTSITTQHPEGILLSNWFLRRIEDKDCVGEVLCAKTGYVVQSGNCAASYALDQSGNGYLCVTAHSTSSWRCIYDHVALYQQFLN